MKKERKSKARQFRLSSIYEIINYFCENETRFKVTFSGYSVKVETADEKYFFTDAKTGNSALFFYAKMNKETQNAQPREIGRINYYDFTGILKEKEKKIERCYCIDLNSAYLQVLLNEGLISIETFEHINNKSKASKQAKESRLKAVGMFAKSTTVLEYENGQPVKDPVFSRNPKSWIYFLAAQKTVLAMQEIKKAFKSVFLCYWVDGIFVKGQAEEVKKALENLGYPCKIEEINNLEITEKALFYTKEEKEKVLFLPRNNTIEISEFRKQLKKAKQL